MDQNKSGSLFIFPFSLALFVLLASCGYALDPITAKDFDLPPQDPYGWSILATSTDTRLVYVDPVDGVDATGTFYGPSAIGGNPQSPNSTMTMPFKTISAAFAKTRANMPDWILLKAGGTFNQSLTMRFGRSPSERAVACAYGTGARPVLQTGTNRGITNAQIANAAIIGIKFYAHTRDPLNPNYLAPTSTMNGDSGFFFTNYNVGWLVRDILLEDCVFEFYTGNGLTNHLSVNPLSNFIMRRCIVSNSYSVATHSSGMGQAQYHGLTIPNMLFQENIFDHNGWIEGGTTGSGATIFNHNIYCFGSRGVVFEGNFVIRASSIGTKWTAETSGSNTYPSDKIVVADNLFAEGEIGISMGANYVGPYRFQNVMVRDNVMTDIGRTQPTKRGLSWYMMIQDWQHGIYDGNLMIHQRTSALTNNAFAYLVNADSTAPTASDDVVVSGNVVADFKGGNATGSALARFGSGSLVTNFTFANNIIQSPTASPLASIYALGGFLFSGTNVYSSTAISTKQFVKSGTTFTDLAGWQAYTGDNGATTTAPVFADPGRDLEHYLPAIGLSGTTFQAFLDAIKGQSKANWNPLLTAHTVNNWLRAGFNMPPVPRGAADMDKDGIPDEYEIANGLDPENSADAGLDSDADGTNNVHEYLLGMRPDKPDHYNWTTATGPLPGTVTVSFPTLVGRNYRVYWSADLQVWQAGSAVIAGTGNVESWTDNGSTTLVPPAAASKRFYRVEVSVAP